MAIRAPWKGWLRVAMPVVQLILLALTLAVATMPILNAATLDLQYYTGTRSASYDPVLHDKIQLVFFWVMIPIVLLIVTTCENFCLWTDRLRPIWVLVSSLVAFALWLTQLVLWTLCLPHSGRTYCPAAYHTAGNIESLLYPAWNTISPNGALYAIPPLLLCYIVQTVFALITLRRLQKTAFRKSDLRGSWALKEELAASRISVASEEEVRFILQSRRPSSSSSASHEDDIPRTAARRLSGPAIQHSLARSGRSRPRAYSAMSVSPNIDNIHPQPQPQPRPESSVYSHRTWTDFSGTWEAESRSSSSTINGAASVVGGRRSSASLTTRTTMSSLVSPIQIDVTTYDGHRRSVNDELV